MPPTISNTTCRPEASAIRQWTVEARGSDDTTCTFPSASFTSSTVLNRDNIQGTSCKSDNVLSRCPSPYAS